MATTLRRELTYDAPPTAVRAMMLDPGFRERVADAQHVVRRSVSVTGDEVAVDLVHASDGVPSFASKFVGEEITVAQRERWSGDRADVSVTIPGKPGEMTGSTALAARGEGTVVTVDLVVKVGIPLVGGKIEGLIAKLLQKGFDKEQQAGQAWLAERA